MKLLVCLLLTTNLAYGLIRDDNGNLRPLKKWLPQYVELDNDNTNSGRRFACPFHQRAFAAVLSICILTCDRPALPHAYGPVSRLTVSCLPLLYLCTRFRSVE